MKTQVTNQFDYTLGELKEPKDFDRSKTYLKVIDKTKQHYNMTYKEGINIDVVPFNDDPNDSCAEGGLYFTTLEHLPSFANYGTLVARIKIPEDAKLILNSNNKYRTDKFEILEFISMNKFLEQVQYIHIETSAYFNNLTSAKGLENLKSIGYDANFRNLESAKGLENLKSIRYNANFKNLKTAKGLENLKSIGESANFDNLESSEGLNNLKSIGGYVNFPVLKTAKGLENLKSIGTSAYFNNLESSEGLNNLKSIGRSADFRNLESAKGLENLKSIGGYAYFYNLTSAKGLEQLKSIGYNAHFSTLTTTEKQKIKALQ